MGVTVNVASGRDLLGAMGECHTVRTFLNDVKGHKIQKSIGGVIYAYHKLIPVPSAENTIFSGSRGLSVNICDMFVSAHVVDMDDAPHA
jgi:hypothetical protein